MTRIIKHKNKNYCNDCRLWLCKYVMLIMRSMWVYESMSVRTHGRRSFCMVFFSLSLHMNLEVTGDLCSCFFRSAFLFRGEETQLTFTHTHLLFFSFSILHLSSHFTFIRCFWDPNFFSRLANTLSVLSLFFYFCLLNLTELLLWQRPRATPIIYGWGL